jgi:PAS domain S-box-containing protein
MGSWKTSLLNRRVSLAGLRPVERYAAATLVLVCTLAVRLVLDPILGNRAPYLFFLLAIVVSKRYWGRGPAVLATVLGGLASSYFLLPPRFSLVITDPTDVLNLLAYLAVGLIVSFLAQGPTRLPRAWSVGGKEVRLRVIRQTAVLAGAVVVLLVMVLLLEYDFTSTDEAERWVVHTYQVIGTAESVRSAVDNAMLAQRRFVQTKDPRDLDAFNWAVGSLQSAARQLIALTADSPPQQARAMAIARLAAERMDTLRDALKLSQTVGTAAAQEAIRTPEAIEVLDNLRTTLDAAVIQERRLLESRTAQAENRAARARWVLGLGSTALLLLLVFASLVIDRETVRREKLAQDLQRHAGLLEQAHDSLLICGLHGPIEYWTPGAEALYGYSSPEALGQFSHGLLQTTHPSGMGQIDGIVEREGYWEGELTQVTKDGRKLVVEARWAVAVDAEGQTSVLQAHTDITARKQAEQQLRDSEAILRSFFDSPGMMRGMVELVDGRITYVSCNEAAAALFGVTPADVPGKTGTELGSSQDMAQRWLALYQEAQRTGKAISQEYPRLDAQGKERWLLGTASYLGMGPSGHPRFAFTVLDMTERKRAEEALRESEERLRALGDNLPEGAIYRYRLDPTGGHHIDFISAGVESFSGVPATEYMASIGTSFTNVLPEDLERMKAAIASSARNLTRFEIEVRHRHRITGKIHWALLRSSPKRLADGTVIWDGIEVDITERKRAEAERELLSTAIEQASESVVITDRDGAIQYVNPAFTRATGYTREEALNQNPRVLKSGRHDAKFYESLWATISAGKLWQGEFINRRKDGTLYTEEATIAPVRDAAGQIANYIAIKADVTGRRHAEIALRESEMMLRFFVEHAPAAIAMFDQDMRYLVVSKRWMSDYRLGNREIRGLSHYEVFPNLPARWKQIHVRCLAGSVERCEEDPFPREDGGLDWVRWEMRPWRKLDETIGGVILFSEVITERKLAEQALEESELRYRQLFNRSHSALAVYETIYSEHGEPCDFRFLDVNLAFENITGLKRSELVGRTVLETTPVREDEWIRLYAQVATTGWPAAFELHSRRFERFFSGTVYSPRPGQVAITFMDVTERRQAEEALRRSEYLLRESQRVGRIGSYEFDIAQGALTTSAITDEIFGIGRDYPRNAESWKASIHPSQREEIAAYLQEVIREKKPFERDYRIVRVVDGVERWVSARGELVLDSSGRPARLIGTVQDITERRLAAEELREQMEELQKVMDVTPVAVWVARDPECLEITGNRMAGQIYEAESWENVSPTVTAARRFFQAGRELTGRELPMQESAARGVDIRNAEVEVLLPSGKTIHLTGNASPLWDAAGHVRGCVGAFLDITERKAAEAALAESELRYRQLFEASESAVAVYEVLYDADNKPRDLRYLSLNPAFEGVTGRDDRQLLGRTALEVTPHLEAYWIDLFGRVAQTGEPATFEHFAAHLGKHISGGAYSPRPNQVAVNFTDVTERVRAEAALRRLNIDLEERVRARTAALEASNKELEAFAHSVSHDLRAPLRGIDGWSLALLEEFNDKLDERGRQYLDRVRTEAQHMGRLIDDLLHLSRVGRTQLVPEDVDLSCLAETVAARLKEAYPQRDLQFCIVPGLRCRADARLLEVALTNLLGNAVKFTAPRHPALIEVGQTQADGRSAFYVRDNGVGFDMNYAGMLFEPFHRLHKVTEFPGSGIGLATVRRVIHKHGGEIWAQGEVGKGATFYFTLAA